MNEGAIDLDKQVTTEMHFQDIEHEPNVLVADVIGFAE